MSIVHLGLGSFFRAHTAWYTACAPDAARWRFAVFAGRSPAVADALNRQGGRYTLLTRGPEKDTATLIGAVGAAYAASDLPAWRALLAAPRTSVVTLTVTESAYLRAAGGGLAADDPRIHADLLAWRHGEPVATVPARLVAGLAGRRLAGSGPIAIVNCDDLPRNGPSTARVVLDFAELAEPALVPWITDHVSFVSTAADRTTVPTTGEDVRAAAGMTGFDDEVPVVAEPFAEWLIEGVFPAGRPLWEAAGARFVPDITPYEQRRELLFGGGCGLLAYAREVDREGHAWLDRWWDEAARHIALPVSEMARYRDALLDRFANPRMPLDRPAEMPAGVLDVLRAERAAGRLPIGALRLMEAFGAALPPDLAADDDLVAALAER